MLACLTLVKKFRNPFEKRTSVKRNIFGSDTWVKPRPKIVCLTLGLKHWKKKTDVCMVDTCKKNWKTPQKTSVRRNIFGSDTWVKKNQVSDPKILRLILGQRNWKKKTDKCFRVWHLWKKLKTKCGHWLSIVKHCLLSSKCVGHLTFFGHLALLLMSL